MSKLAIPANSKFDARRAMELANLVQRAYEQFNSYKEGKAWEPEVSNKLTGSTTCDADLNWPSHEGKVAYDLCAVFHVTERTLIVSKTVPLGFIAQRKLANGTLGIFIVFRGTLTTAEWLDDFEIGQEPFLGDDTLGSVSLGFQKIYAGEERKGNSLRQTVADILKNIPSNAQIFVTGHSLGAALATLATVHISTQTQFKKPILYTYASPRVGDKIFAAQFTGLEHYRIANSEDLVPAVPLSIGQLMGHEMSTPSMRKNIASIGKLAKLIGLNLLEQIYQHAGEPLYFTEQKDYISTNHNLFDTYRGALSGSIPRLVEVKLQKQARVA